MERLRFGSRTVRLVLAIAVLLSPAVSAHGPIDVEAGDEPQVPYPLVGDVERECAPLNVLCVGPVSPDDDIVGEGVWDEDAERRHLVVAAHLGVHVHTGADDPSTVGPVEEDVVTPVGTVPVVVCADGCDVPANPFLGVGWTVEVCHERWNTTAGTTRTCTGWTRIRMRCCPNPATRVTLLRRPGLERRVDGVV